MSLATSSTEPGDKSKHVKRHRANACVGMAERSYLDWNATAPLRPRGARGAERGARASGNPSSVHAEGRAARRLVEQAREQVAALVGARARAT